MKSAQVVRPKMPELDSLRGIAILLVVFLHGFYWSTGLQGLSGVARMLVNATHFGWVGVNLFFVLSGFLITGILVESRGRQQYYRRFYVRRALRILPAFYAMLLLLALWPEQSHAYLWLSFFYMSNLAPLFGIRMTYGMLWSLAVEEHFYLVWPFAVRRLSNRTLLICAISIFVAVPLLRAWYFSSPELPEGFAYFTWLVADGLAAGAILALFVRRPECSRKHIAWFSGAAICLSMLVVLGEAHYGVLTQRRLPGAIFILTAVHLFFLGVTGLTLLVGTSRWSFLVDRPVLRFFGEISYGLYLIHWLVFASFDAVLKRYGPGFFATLGRTEFIGLRFLCAGGTATMLAFLSRRYFEEPFLRLKNRVGGAA